mgnify:CR=1 FL=1
MYLEDNNKKNLKLINTGYLKLDHVHKKVYKSSISEDAILLAPTLSSMFLEYNLSPFLDEIIHEILNDKKFKLIKAFLLKNLKLKKEQKLNQRVL